VGRSAALASMAASERPEEAVPPAVSQAGEGRIARIESLRALAAVGVVACHVFGATVGQFFVGIENRVASGIGFGGYFFFALSGCLLYIPFVRRDFGGGGRIELGRYALNRAVRIFPLYYVALFVVLLVFYGGGSLSQWAEWGLFLENLTPDNIMSVNGVLWTIVIELHFYILLPLIAWLILRGSRGSLKGAMLVLGLLVAASLTFRILHVILPSREFLNPLRMSFPSLFYLIGAGMFVALVREAWLEQRPRWLRGPFASPDVWALASIPFWFLFVLDYDLEPLFAIGCFLLLGAAVLPLDRGFLVRGLDWRPLALLGLTSYSIYIWHHPILKAVTERHVWGLDGAIWRAQQFFGSDYVGMLVVVVPFSCAVAALSYMLIESPALRLRKRWGEFRRQSVELRAPAQAPPATAGRMVTSSPSSTGVSSPSRNRMSSPPT
jgi:peptidoglycan/LPS O-acetylase OafA/YrhL